MKFKKTSLPTYPLTLSSIALNSKTFGIDSFVHLCHFVR